MGKCAGINQRGSHLILLALLQVHRYKKHPQVPDPAECTLCRKMFFDRQMLENHTPTCNRKPITATGAHQQDQQQQHQQQQQQLQQQRGIFKHKTGDDDDDDEDDDQLLLLDDGAGVGGGAGAGAGEGVDSNGGGNNTVVAVGKAGKTGGTNSHSSTGTLKIRIPEVACTICGARFTDQEMFSKHIQRHEQELYVDNPLAAMFDDGPADAGQFQVERQNENGEYACDLCAKTFPQVIALKVHRKWHFRGDSKQVSFLGLCSEVNLISIQHHQLVMMTHPLKNRWIPYNTFVLSCLRTSRKKKKKTLTTKKQNNKKKKKKTFG